MKLSILLPTRDRLEYLKLAVQSVLRQDGLDWELVISDNCSEGDIAGHLSSIGDPRIVYSRTEEVLPVTENWNRALAHSSGDYIVMLGDDDALLDGYVREMQDLVRKFGNPDLIYTKALLFTYPGVDPAHPTGFLMDHGCAEFLAGASGPFVLDPKQALGVVRAAMSFRVRYDFNAQFALISRRLIEALKVYGDFYQSAFPDFYSMNAAFLRAGKIVVDPAPRLVIGVTPKSYGYFHVNQMENEGRAFLDGASTPAPPGSNINVGWLSAVTALEQGVGADFGLRVDHRRYRFLQAANVYTRQRAGAIDKGEVRRMEAELELPLVERWTYRAGSSALGLLPHLLPPRLQTAVMNLTQDLVGPLPRVYPTMVEGAYSDVIEVCKDRDGGRSDRSPQLVHGQQRDQL